MSYDKGPWLAHTGGPCPVDPGALVEFRVNRKHSVPTLAKNVKWGSEHTARHWRVTSYRVLTPITEEGTTK